MTRGHSLILFGALVGVLASFAPRLPSYLPSSVTSSIPFLSSLSVPASGEAWSKYQRYQSNIPIAANHDPHDEKEPREERLRRMSSADSKRALERQEKKKLKELEERTESAGAENMVRAELPAYWVVGGNSFDLTSPTWSQISREVDFIKPAYIIVLHRTSSPKPTFSTSPLSSLLQAAFARQTITSKLVPAGTPFLPTTDAIADFLGVADPTDRIVEVGVPEGNADHSHVEDWIAIGEGLRLARKEAVVIAVGDEFSPRALSTKNRNLFHQVLAHHTSHPREHALERFETKRVVGPELWAVVGSAGECEGEELDAFEGDGSGEGWRFGHLPHV
ncbi:hypothetical protein MNV49_005265 [Pseudohyphozyma bogoriensis]|nr:hypothetical protein MNV49_005265 [Pseudohyphozyma bogoriensis]